MPTTGLSLFGFYAPDVAAQYLSNACHVSDPSPEALYATWALANQRLGAPPTNAGVPAVADLPAECSAHLAQLQAHPLMARFMDDFGACEV